MEYLITGTLVTLFVVNVILLARHEYLEGKLARIRRKLEESEAYEEIVEDLALIWWHDKHQWERERSRLQKHVSAKTKKLSNVKELADATYAELSGGSRFPMTADALSDLAIHRDYGPQSLYVAWSEGGTPTIGEVNHVQYELSREKVGINHTVSMGRNEHDLELHVDQLMQQYPSCDWEIRDDLRSITTRVQLSETAWIYCGPVIVGEMNIHNANRDLQEMMSHLRAS